MYGTARDRFLVDVQHISVTDPVHMDLTLAEHIQFAHAPDCSPGAKQ